MRIKLLIFIFCLGTIFSGNGQTATITASATKVCGNTDIIFTGNLIGGTATIYSWNFGDGTNWDQQSFTKNYATPNTYTVTLTINNTYTTSIQVTILALPTVNFTVNDSAGCFPLNVQFTDQSTPGSAGLAKWYWGFGDGVTSNLRNPSHTYDSAANFPVTLQVTDSNGCANTAVKSGYIKISSGVVPNFSIISSAGCSLPITINTSNTTTYPPGSTMTYTWNFGDGSGTIIGLNPQHTYSVSNNYNVKLIASSSAGCSDSVTNVAKIVSGNVQSNFTVPDSVCLNTAINIINTSAPTPTVSNWNFGRGNNDTSTAINPQNILYTNAGNYTIKLTNTFGTCIDSASKTITVLSPPVANYTATPLISCDSIFTVNFQNTSTGTVYNYYWNFGDGTIGQSPNPTHTYTNYGTYAPFLTITSIPGCSSSFQETPYINSFKPTVTLNNFYNKGCAPFTYTPQITDSAVDGVKNYIWNFGDGTIITTTSPTVPPHTYSNPGFYPFSVTINTNGGCTATASDTVKVGTIKPSVSFTASSLSVCVNQLVSFTDQSTGNPNEWLWNFGNNGYSIAKNPTTSYANPGNYTVTLTAYNNGCNDSASQTITVNPPQANFGYTYSCSSNIATFIFNDSFPSGINTWLWNFGDGSPTNNNPGPITHVFPSNDSTYTVTLTVSGSNGCTTTDTAKVQVQTNHAILLSNNGTSICKNNQISIFAAGTINWASGYNYFHFDFADGDTLGQLNNGNAVHLYTTSGNYTITLIITTLAGCADTAYLPITVNGPSANFKVNDTISCTPFTAAFTDLSSSFGLNPITQEIWSFGDGTTQTFSKVQTSPVTHNYTSQGIYTVKLTVTDSVGCVDSLVIPNYVTVALPQASFTSLDSLSCPGSPIQFVNNSKGYNLSYEWSFSDGTTDTAVNPTHLFPFGNSSAKLTVTDQFGCSNTTNPYPVYVDTPYAAFVLQNPNDTFASCPPLTENFVFTGEYYKTVKWFFGDGGVSGLLNPVYLYTLPGTYTVNLIVTSHGGCTDTAAPINIHILGPIGSLSYTPLEGCHNLTVDFTLTTNNNVTKYLWQFDSTQFGVSTSPDTTFTYTSIGIFKPTVIIQDTTGCSVPIHGDTTISIYGSQPNFGAVNRVVCQSGNVQFTDSTIYVGTPTNWLWQFGDGGSDTVQNPIHYYAQPGLYPVTLITTVQSSCQDTIVKSNFIKVVANPVIDITGDSVKCQPATMNFQGIILVPDTLSSTYAWKWVFGNGNTSTLQNPPAQLYTIAGPDTVKLTATNSYNCSDTAYKAILIDSISATNAGPDTAICVGTSAQLHASSTSSSINYLWLPPTNSSLSSSTIPNPVATPTTTTTYYVQGTNVVGCATTDSVVVTVVQPSTLTLTPLADSLCLGQSVQLVATGEQVYSWSPSAGLSNPSISNPIAKPDTSTTYVLTASDSLFCFPRTQSAVISVFNYPKVSITPNIATILVGASYQISAKGSSDIDSINWVPSIGLSCANCLSPLATPINTTTYTLNVVNNGNCPASDSIKIIVLCNGENIFVPNTFSPNGDGVNDWFFVQGKGLTTVQSIRIFDRWGEMVFEKKDFPANVQQQGWDGNFKGKPAPIDVYVYTIEVICENSQVVTFNGNVALIR